MKTMRLSDGDLVIGASSDYQMVTDAHKVMQDVRCALLEPLGNDRFHPGWGSSLHDFVGQPLTEFTRTRVLSEVNRVVSNYAAVQRDKIETDMYSNSESRFGTDEIVASVAGVRARDTYDGLRLTVGISTVAGSNVVLTEVI